MESNWDVIVIGAGMAGLSAAQKLQAAGLRVLVLEKSRGVGGRMATRRDEAGQWDHGAQYFTARSAAFRRQVAIWLRAHLISRWDRPVYVWDGQNLQSSTPQQRFVGTPKMNAPLSALAAQFEVKLSVHVSAIQPCSQGWEVHAGEAGCAAEHIWSARQVILAIPAPQAATLIPPAQLTQSVPRLAAQIPMQPCWAVMLSSESAIHLPFAGAFINVGSLSWIAHDSSKPGRSGQHWLLHASEAWSQAHLEHTPEAVAELLCNEFNQLLRAWGQTEPKWRSATAHRWRYARGNATDEVVQSAVHSAETGLVVAGDWLASGRVEGAYLSGLAAADALLAALAATASARPGHANHE